MFAVPNPWIVNPSPNFPVLIEFGEERFVPENVDGATAVKDESIWIDLAIKF